MERDRENAHRLISALWRHADGAALWKLSQVLDYEPNQLSKDIICLYGYVTELERNEKGAEN